MQHRLRRGLPPLPPHMRGLPVNAKGYPVPWFVGPGIDGEPDFRVVDAGKIGRAINQRLCWLCGRPIGKTASFTVGPMCVINRISAEPPSHRACASFAAKACPFLAHPKAVRREANMPEHGDMPGLAVLSNPGATVVWTTASWESRPVDGGVLFTMGEPIAVDWFAEGRRATGIEAVDAFRKGADRLAALAQQLDGPDGLAEAVTMTVIAQKFLPAASLEGRA